jgi:ankyrin repeat protein
MMKSLSVILFTGLTTLLFISSSTFAQQDVRLIEATAAQDASAFRVMLDLGVDVNALEVDGTTALHWAAHRDNVEMASALLQAGANIHAHNRYEVAPLSLAAVNGNVAMVRLLLDAGADPNTAMAQNETALMTASRTGVVAVVQLFLDAGAQVNASESWRGQTALMWAAGEGNLEVTQMLLTHGADVHARSEKGFTPLLFAAREGKVDLIRPLLAAGANVDETLPSRAAERTESGQSNAAQTGVTSLLLAAGSAHYELAALLLEEGADPNHAPLGWTPLHQLSWVRKAGQAGSNNPSPQGSGSMGSLEFARKLVEHGADLDALVTERPPVGVSALNMKGGTAFLLAARTADAELMSLLAELGADPLRANENYSTPLMVAAGLGTGAPGEDPGTELEVLAAVQVALTLGGDINAVDDYGETAMHGAAYKHLPEVVQFLSDSGAEISVWNQENREGWTPLAITQGIHRGMSVISSRETELAIQQLLDSL